MTRKNYLSYTCLAILLSLFSLPAYAYLDPGNGSVLLQSLLAGTAGIAAIMKLYWQQVKNTMVRILKRKSTVENKQQSYHEDR